MPRKRGWVLGDRDRLVLRALGEVGPLPWQQLWDVAGRPGLEKNFKRSLLRLTEKRGAVPAYLLVYEHPYFSPLYSLTHHGIDEVRLRHEQVPNVNMSWAEIRHQNQTGDVYAGLMRAQHDPKRPNFVWIGDRGAQWNLVTTFNGFRDERIALRPDVIIQSKTHDLRVFVEVETGSNPIRRGSRNAGASVLGKVRGYAAFLAEFERGSFSTWYRNAFGDDRPALVMVVTTSFRRRNSVAGVLAADAFLKSRETRGWSWMVVTTEEAPIQLERLLSGKDPLDVERVRQRLGYSEPPVRLGTSRLPDPPRPGNGGAGTAENRDVEHHARTGLNPGTVQQLQEDRRTIFRCLVDYRDELARIEPLLGPSDRNRVRALLSDERTLPLNAAAHRLRDTMRQLESNGIAAPTVRSNSK